MLLAAKPKANIGNKVTIYSSLKKEHKLRNIKRNSAPFLSKPLINYDLIPRFLTYYQHAAKHTWIDQPWYEGTGLHYSDKCKISPITKQVCGGNTHADYSNTMLFDTPVNNEILSDIETFPLVRSKITRFFGVKDGGTIHEARSWHRDEHPHEVLRIIIPLETSDEYMFQLDNYEAINLKVGMIYAFDQSILHRVFKKSKSFVNRTHLILSYVTWFRKCNDNWLPTEYAGKVHPMDLFDLVKL